MDSFDVVNTGLVILLALLFFLVRKAVSGGVRDVVGTGGLNGGEDGLSASEVLDRRCATREITGRST
jgi:hypothetical protein